jgi:NAD(P)-dependent dehydrogenase (short-subunit alcohol dehydrogenase family)
MTQSPMGWVLITGAGKRLGRAVAEHLSDHGWAIAVHYNSARSEAEDLTAAIIANGAAAIAIGADLADPAAAQSLCQRAMAASGAPLSGLVNCASIFEHDTIDTLTPALFEHHMRVNTLAPMLLCQAFAHALPEGQTGAIVNFLDFKLAQPYPDHLSYTLSKYALMGGCEMLARGLAPRVRVNAVAPGYVLPSPGQPQEDFERLHANTPLARGATPSDIAGAVRYLLESPAITGQTIYVDAGLRFRSFDRDLAFM